jgi:hypothetical protein
MTISTLPTTGDDVFEGAAITSTDTLDGGTGRDTLKLYTNYTLPATVGSDNIVGIEVINVAVDTGINVRWQHSRLTGNVTGMFMNSSDVGDDTLGGTDANDTIMGNGGNDSLQGFNANDSIDGGAGNDIIKAGKGNDTVLGGDGNDTLIGGRGDDSVNGGAGDDTIDLVTFGTVNTAIGPQGGGNNVLSGDAGNDTIWGSVGNDSLLGGDGNDLLLGNAGNDTLNSGLGTDSVFGGQGDDSIQIDGNVATLYYNTSAVNADGINADGIDTIVGFTPGVDKISLISFDATASQTFSATALDALALTGAALQTAIDAAVASQQTNGTGILSLSNGTKMIFSGVGADISASDFVGGVAPAPTAVAVSAAGNGDASVGDITFTVAGGNYTYTIAGFGAGDKIDFPVDQAPTIINSSVTDNSVDIQWAFSGQTVIVTLTGLTTAQDEAIYSVGSFNSLFGADSIF